MQKSLNKDVSELLKGGAEALFLRIIGAFILFGSTIYITNIFGASIYGDFSLFVTSLKLLAVVAVFGTDMFMVRSVSNNLTKGTWIKVREDNCLSYGVIFLIGGFLSLLLLIFGKTISLKLELGIEYVIILAVSIIPFSLIKLHGQCFRGVKNIRNYASFEFIYTYLIFALFVLCIPFFFNVPEKIFLGAAFGSSTILVAIMSFIQWSKHLKISSIPDNHLKVTITRKRLKELMSRSAPYLLATSFTLVSIWIIQFGIKYYGSSKDLGVFDAMFKVGTLVSIPLMAINSITAPKLSENYSRNDLPQLKATAKNATYISIAVCFPVALILLLFPNQIMGLFGAEFTGNINAYYVIILAGSCNAFTGPVGILLQMTDNEKAFRDLALACSLACFMSSLVFIPTLGIFGASLSFLIFVFIGAIMGVYMVYRKFGFLSIPFGF